MNVKISRKANKKIIGMVFLGAYALSMTAYGSYAAGLALKAYGVRTYDGFIAGQAEARGLDTKTVTKTVPVIDPEAAAGIITKAATDGAAKGADSSIASHLGK